MVHYSPLVDEHDLILRGKSVNIYQNFLNDFKKKPIWIMPISIIIIPKIMMPWCWRWRWHFFPVPAKVSDLRITSVGTDYVALTWKCQTSHVGVDTYEVKYWKNDDIDEFLSNYTLSNNITLYSMLQRTRYSFQVVIRHTRQLVCLL